MFLNPSESNIQQYIQNSVNILDSVSDVSFICNDGVIPSHQVVLAPFSKFLRSEFQLNFHDKVISILLPDYCCSEIREYLLDLFNFNNIRHAKLNSLFGAASLGSLNVLEEDDLEELTGDNKTNEALHKESSNSDPDLNKNGVKEDGIVSLEFEYDQTEQSCVKAPSKSKYSIVWNYFDIIDYNRSNCRQCGKTISCSAGTGQMRYHLAYFHPNLVSQEFKADVLKNRERKMPSIVWNYFDKLKDRSVCRHCGKTTKLRASATDNSNRQMRYHLAYYHPNLVGQEFVAKVLKNRGKKIRSIAWDHFEKLDQHKSRCRHCGKNISCSTGPSGMRKHLACVHADIMGEEFVRKVLYANVGHKDVSEEYDLEESIGDNKSIDAIYQGLSNSDLHLNKNGVEEDGIVNLEFEYDQDEQSYVKAQSNLNSMIKRDNLLETKTTDKLYCSKKIPKNRSMVWDYFDRVEDRSNCRHCEKSLKIHDTSTGQMRYHLAYFHSNLVGQEFVAKILKNSGQRKIPSIVWDHFEKLDQHTSMCKHCGKSITRTSSCGTSGMRSHLASVHAHIMGEEFVRKVLYDRKNWGGRK